MIAIPVCSDISQDSNELALDVDEEEEEEEVVEK